MAYEEVTRKEFQDAIRTALLRARPKGVPSAIWTSLIRQSVQADVVYVGSYTLCPWTVAERNVDAHTANLASITGARLEFGCVFDEEMRKSMGVPKFRGYVNII